MRVFLLVTAVLFLLLPSCSERVKVVELRSIEVDIDSTFHYKIERVDGNGDKYFDYYNTRTKCDNGEYIMMY